MIRIFALVSFAVLSNAAACKSASNALAPHEVIAAAASSANVAH